MRNSLKPRPSESAKTSLAADTTDYTKFCEEIYEKRKSTATAARDAFIANCVRTRRELPPQAQIARTGPGDRLAELRKQNGPSLETSEGREFILPVINYLRSRRGDGVGVVYNCDQMIAYTGGSVLGRSIEGNIGVILVKLVGLNTWKYSIGPIGEDARLCGPVYPEAAPGQTVNIQVKGIFRKYDTGWRLEQVQTQ